MGNLVSQDELSAIILAQRPPPPPIEKLMNFWLQLTKSATSVCDHIATTYYHLPLLLNQLQVPFAYTLMYSLTPEGILDAN